MHPGCSSASPEMWIKNEVRWLSGLIDPRSAQTDGLCLVWPGWDLTFDPAGLLQRWELWASSFTHLLSRLHDVAVIHHLAALCSVPAPRSCPREEEEAMLLGGARLSLPSLTTPIATTGLPPPFLDSICPWCLRRLSPAVIGRLRRRCKS